MLEHIPDDAKALSEIRRVLKPGGFALLTVPQNHSLEHTYEDARITDPMERFWHFGAYDHKRFYGRDFPLRAAAAGFAVEAYRRPPGDEVRHALLRDEVLYVARHEAAGAPPR